MHKMELGMGSATDCLQFLGAITMDASGVPTVYSITFLLMSSRECRITVTPLVKTLGYKEVGSNIKE